MKKAFVCIIVVIAVCMCWSTIVFGDVPIDEAHFPDAYFRAYVRSSGTSFDKNQDGILNDAEIAEIKEVSVGVTLLGAGPLSLKGIEYFPALEVIYASGYRVNGSTLLLPGEKDTPMKLTELDISKNLALTKLACNYGSLSTLTLGDNAALTYLSCYQNQIENLDISKCTALTYLDCDSNNIAELSVNSPVLTKLYCSYNKLESLDVSKASALIDLFCRDNKLTHLDVSQNILLNYLVCENNLLSNIDLCNNDNLFLLSCSDNNFTALDLDNITNLQKTINVEPIIGVGYQKYDVYYGHLGTSISPQKVLSVDITSNVNTIYPYKLALETISLDSSKLNNRITSLDVSDSSGNKLIVSNDENYMYFSSLPFEMTYYYDTTKEREENDSEYIVVLGSGPFDEPYMKVTITFVNSAPLEKEEEEKPKEPVVPESDVSPDVGTKNDSSGCNSGLFIIGKWSIWGLMFFGILLLLRGSTNIPQ